ncbi:hypothetical protein FIT69_04600 [Candidatus Methylopumilus planktonicus]|uniref:hypothetical protein n=1 Tax=Candidatus Methylopumilus planktonicus TaxID=1581557 RepID=UPI00111D1814|nr:hypothetical protein [Candidatus Methylopumilus planktonicus]QDD01847.1 hypothetical protein FIT69_04600 [Candidatus Methylopumilus planktonicus]
MFSISRAIHNFRRNRAYQLPEYRCTKWIEVAGPQYNDPYYKVIVELETSKIISWVENRDKFSWVSYHPNQISKELFPSWLKVADFDDESVTKLDFYQRKLLKEYISTFIQMGAARVYCSICEKYYSAVIDIVANKTRIGNDIKWTQKLYCPKKHSLSIDKYHIHVNERPVDLDEPAFLRNKK